MSDPCYRKALATECRLATQNISNEGDSVQRLITPGGNPSPQSARRQHYWKYVCVAELMHSYE